MFAESFIVHEEVDDLARSLVRSEPFYIFVRRQRPFVPTAVREAEGDVVREFVVAQQQAQFLVDGVGVYIVGRFPAQHVLGTFGQHRTEAHFGHCGADVVGVDQLCVSEGGRFHPEFLFYKCRVEFYLFGEILLRSQRGQRVGVSLGEELYATRGGQFLERFEDFGRIGAELFDGDARDRERAAELTLVFPDELQQQGVHRQVALPGDFLHDGAVQQVVQIVVILAHVEEAVLLQSPGLVYLKI